MGGENILAYQDGIKSIGTNESRENFSLGSIVVFPLTPLTLVEA
jgi:hypothetical protein